MAKTMAKLQARAKKTSSKKKSAPRLAKAPTRQKFNVNHFRLEDFKADGLRNYARYRDLGMGKATKGLLQAHVIRLVPPCDPAVVSKRHFHEVDIQMIYVLKGWIKSEFEGQGEVTMREGAAWLQPPCSTIPTIASCWRSSLRPNSRRWNWRRRPNPRARDCQGGKQS